MIMIGVKGRKRVIITDMEPQVECGDAAVKRTVGEELIVKATIFTNGHDRISASVLLRNLETGEMNRIKMNQVLPWGLDIWEAGIPLNETGTYSFTVQGWIDHYSTWKEALLKKIGAGQDVSVELMMGINMLKESSSRLEKLKADILEVTADGMDELRERDQVEAVRLAEDQRISDILSEMVDPETVTTYTKELKIDVERRRSLFSSWYEIFPRSFGGLKGVRKLLPRIAGMGFDVLYLPPVHPIGSTNRKGKNNSTSAEENDPGSPWAIGSGEGGHRSIHPDLGTFEDLRSLIEEASDNGIEIALDLAFQCSSDHPYVKEHPEWFRWRPDGTIRFAENPPKRYEDIVPIDFETEKWQELWKELLDVVLFWTDHGIRIFRVDNPHTKPVVFWRWLINNVRSKHPDVLFLSEAFTRPPMMKELAKAGFTQSYTYFTWRNTKWELEDFMNELVNGDSRQYLRPNFWPNTPDILPEFLQNGGRPAFMIRLILAATLSSNYGIYGPAFELCVNDPVPGREEYLNSEKYEIKDWDLEDPDSLSDFIGRINRIRRESPALQNTWNYRKLDVDNESIMAFMKAGDDDVVIVVVNLDPYNIKRGGVEVVLESDELERYRQFMVHDLLGDERYIWHEGRNEVVLDPHILPGRIFKIRKKVKTERDFDYFM